MKTYDQLLKEVVETDEKLRMLALHYIVESIEAFGDRKTLRTLQACFIAGYKLRVLEEEANKTKLFLEADEALQRAKKEQN